MVQPSKMQRRSKLKLTKRRKRSGMNKFGIHSKNCITILIILNFSLTRKSRLIVFNLSFIVLHSRQMCKVLRLSTTMRKYFSNKEPFEQSTFHESNLKSSPLVTRFVLLDMEFPVCNVIYGLFKNSKKLLFKAIDHCQQHIQVSD